MGLVKQNQQVVPTTEQRQFARDFPGLLQLLQSNDSQSRRWAARDLSAYVEAVGPLLTQLWQEPERVVRQAIFGALTMLGTSQAVDGLISCLRSEEANLRNDAIEAMKLMPAVVAPMMDSLLHDPDADVRIFAINVLESLQHPNVEQWLLDVISQDPHVNVCATALDLLAEVGTVAAVAPLQALQQRFSDEPFMHFAIDVALTRIKGA
ncbi:MULTISPECIES: HEAT repeat domain-containing protein [Aeromonas]|nr:HEAT repeat domain-containing protein [Aeromonas veronii]MCJ8216260.1 HEAT repeat domain-containing protein [Aeromonas veronii]MXV30944.1 HEAT repeat domain-containing protein [Aeromonas veronii]HDZ8846990.1 HEAT repeat domain-containing protein [Aeromonas veronii]